MTLALTHLTIIYSSAFVHISPHQTYVLNAYILEMNKNKLNIVAIIVKKLNKIRFFLKLLWAQIA